MRTFTLQQLNLLSLRKNSAAAAATRAGGTSEEMSDSSPIKLAIFSWNVGNASPHEHELSSWLDEGGGDWDMLVVGTQENVLPGTSSDAGAGAATRLGAMGEWEAMLLRRPSGGSSVTTPRCFLNCAGRASPFDPGCR